MAMTKPLAEARPIFIAPCHFWSGRERDHRHKYQYQPCPRCNVYEDYWNIIPTHSIGERVFIRTANKLSDHQKGEEIYRIEIKR